MKRGWGNRWEECGGEIAEAMYVDEWLRAGGGKWKVCWSRECLREHVERVMRNMEEGEVQIVRDEGEQYVVEGDVGIVRKSCAESVGGSVKSMGSADEQSVECSV